MKNQPVYPQPNDAAAIVNEWLCWVDDVFECANPQVDLKAIIEHVLVTAIIHPDLGVRCEALRVLRSGLINHSSFRVGLRAIAERLPQVGGDELLLSIHVIGLSGDCSLAEYVLPLLKHHEMSVRAEASDCLAELRKGSERGQGPSLGQA